MIATLAALVVAQCSGGSCPAPVRFMPSRQYQPQRIQYQEPRYVPETRTTVQPPQLPTHEWYWTEHDGLSFRVWGYVLTKADGDRYVSWNPDSPANQRAWNEAKALKAKAAAAKPAPTPEKPLKPEVPAEKTGALGLGQFQGVEPQRVNGHGYSLNGHPVPPRYAQDASKAAGRPQVTVIGTDRERDAIENDWKNDPRFKQFHDTTWFKGFKPDDWQVKDTGFVPGHPSVIFQRPDGEEVFRDPIYGGPIVFEAALRKIQPDYDPAKTPQSTGTTPSSGGEYAAKLILVVGVVVGVALLLFPRKPT